MSTQVRLRGGTTSQHNTFTGAEREVTVDTTKDTLVVHDGSTAGGIPLAKEADIAGKADTSTVNTQLAAKADTSYVNTQLATKASTSALAAKADTTTVNSQLAAKADTSTVNSGLAGKAALAGSGGQSFSASTMNATSIDLGDWTITQSGSSLKFAYNGTDRFSLSSAGALVVENNITAFGSA